MTYENSRYFHRADRLPITVIRDPSSVGVGAGCALDQISQTLKSSELITENRSPAVNTYRRRN